MNENQRSEMVSCLSIRPVYGGKFEPFLHVFYLAILYGGYFYATKGEISHKGQFLALVIFSFSMFFWLPIINYRRVGKIHNLGSATKNDLERELTNLRNEGYVIKTHNKMAIEAYCPRSALFLPNTHVVVFLYKGSLFAGAWRYGARGFEYVPFYFGTDVINRFRRRLEERPLT